jgi:glycosyltransferase involved in cell wall biosynthesis
VHIEELVTAFRKAGHQVLIGGPSFYAQANFRGESKLLSVMRRWLPRALLEVAELMYNIPAFLRLRTGYRRFEPELIYERYSLYYVAGLLLKKCNHIPYYLEVNSPLAAERARFGGLALDRFALFLERLVWRSADRIFVVTEVLKQLVVATGVMSEKVTVIPNGVDRDTLEHESYRPSHGDTVTLGFIGFIRDWHGLDIVLDALATNRDSGPVRFVIVGDGPARPALERQVAKLGIAELVRFVGIQQRQSIQTLIREFDIALQPKAVAYASPLKIFEYMACGRAIVAPDQPNIREILTHGETAILFDPDEPGALWRAIRLLAADPKLRERLGRAARYAVDRYDYTWQGNAAKITMAVETDFAATVTAKRP